MIKIIKSYDECRDFVSDFLREEPVQDDITERLIRHIENPDKNRVIGVYADEAVIIGLKPPSTNGRRFSPISITGHFPI